MRKVMLGFDSSNTCTFTHSVVAYRVPGAIFSEGGDPAAGGTLYYIKEGSFSPPGQC